MNTRQKWVLILTAVILLGMLLFPPFQAQVQGTVHNLGYHYLAAPPHRGGIPASVNIQMLVVQWLGVALVGAIALLLLKGPQRGAASAAGSHQPLPDSVAPPAVNQSRTFLGGHHHPWRRSIGAVPAILLVWIVSALITQSVQATSDAPGTQNNEPSGQQFPATLAAAETYENPYDAYQRGDYMTALRVIKPLAEQGHAGAQIMLGVMYYEGQGVPKDDAEAVRWTRLAAEQGRAEAQYSLGFKYKIGHGVSQDDAEAVKWFLLAAEQGHAEAQFNLGGMYFMGEGVPEDYVQAHKWYNLAAAHYPASKAFDRKAAATFRNNLGILMTPAQVAEAQRLARGWRPKPGGD